MLGFKFISDNQILTKMERWKLLEFFVFGETFKILSPSPALLKHVNFELFFSQPLLNGLFRFRIHTTFNNGDQSKFKKGRDAINRRTEGSYLTETRLLLSYLRNQFPN